MKKIRKLKNLKLSNHLKEDEMLFIKGGYGDGCGCGCGRCHYQDGGPGFNVGMTVSGLTGPSCGSDNLFLRALIG